MKAIIFKTDDDKLLPIGAIVEVVGTLEVFGNANVVLDKETYLMPCDYLIVIEG